MIVGTGYDDPYHSMTPAWARAIGPRGIGFQDCFVMVALDFVNTKPDVRSWSIFDRTIAALEPTGIGITIKAMGIPAHASEGKGAYQRNELGLWQKDPSWAKDNGWHLAAQCGDSPPFKLCAACLEKPERVEWANNPPRVNYSWLQDISGRMAERYKHVARNYIWGNEPDESLFSPEIRLANLGRMTRTEAIGMLSRHDRSRAAFKAGVLSAHPEARFIGPEAAYFGGFEEALMSQSQSNGVHYNETSFHAYAPKSAPFPGGSLARIENEFLPTFEKFVGRRAFDNQFAITEIDDGGTGKAVQFLRECVKVYGSKLSRVHLYNMESRLFQTWPPVGDQIPMLTDMGVELQQFNIEQMRDAPDLTNETNQLRVVASMIDAKQAQARKWRGES